MSRRITFFLALLIIPGALAALMTLLVARVLARTPRGQRMMIAVERRMPTWMAPGLRALQGKNISHLSQATS